MAEDPALPGRAKFCRASGAGVGFTLAQAQARTRQNTHPSREATARRMGHPKIQRRKQRRYDAEDSRND